MIKNISDYKYKSWKDGSNISSIDFNQINIIFGHNGAGKSSLSQGVYKEFLKTNADKQAIRAFGSRYVDSTLLLEDKTGIKGVISNFGKKDVDIEKQILTNKKRLSEIDGEIENESKTLNLLTENTDKVIKDIVARRKGTAQSKQIHNKPYEKTVHEKVRLWFDDYEKAYKDFPNEDYNTITGETDYTAEIEQLNNLYIEQSPDFEKNLLDELQSIVEKSYPQVDVPESQIINWLQTGITIHEDKTICEFCGSKLNVESIKIKVDKYLNDERHKASQLLESSCKKLRTIVETAQKIVNNKSLYISHLELKNDDFTEVEKAVSFLINLLTENIEKKINDMSSKHTMPSGTSNAINAIQDILVKLSNAKTKRSKEVTEKINRLETLVKGAIGFEINNSTVINENLQKIEEQDKKLRTLRGEKSVLEQNNKDLEAKKSDLTDFAVYLNKVLSDLNLNFKLELNNKSYVLKHTDGSNIKVSDISDGEKNLLAIIYFYYEMLNDSDGGIKDSIKLIVIDDPISSLDDGNKFYITELIKSILSENNAQVFVLTHSWDDFCNFVYGREGKETTSTFEICKIDGISSIKVINNERLIKPYKILYKEIFQFSQKDINDITHDELLHIPNTLRRVIEEYIKFVVDVDFATAHKNGDISKALFRLEIAELSNTKRQKLNTLLSVCNILSHKANQPKNGTDVHLSAKFLMNSIEESNKFHHLKMRE